MNAYETDRDLLETNFMDKYGSVKVLQMIEEIADLKSQHVKENWGPPMNENGRIDQAWDKISRHVENAKRNIIDACKITGYGK